MQKYNLHTYMVFSVLLKTRTVLMICTMKPKNNVKQNLVSPISCISGSPPISGISGSPPISGISGSNKIFGG